MVRNISLDLATIAVPTLELPSRGECLLRDSVTPALALRLRASGARTWVMFDTKGGKSVRLTFGNALVIPVKTARLMASAKVVDPSEPEGDASPSAPLFRADALLSDLLPRYLAAGAAGRWKVSTGRQMAAVAKVHILPAMGDRRVRDITSADVTCWHRDISAKSTSARMALSTLSGMMLYAEDHGVRPAGSNPCRGLRKKQVGHRGRHLPPATIRRLWAALDRLQSVIPDACDAVRLLMLTGARRSEILGLTWERIRDARAVLDDSKSGPRTIWLNSPAIAVLERRRATVSGSFVFPAPVRTGPLTVIDRPWRVILKEASVAPFRVHDLRHHYASVAVSNGIDVRIVGQLLGHSDLDSTLGYAHLATDTLAKSASRVASLIDRSMSSGRVTKKGERRVLSSPRGSRARTATTAGSVRHG